ncbi:M20 family metallopeptidase [Christensenellaceae bacterium OttesenSCG-928-M15]|nr:M20 family metallopeptidase [Christensenellaceae bacterium OttesenSCG-928-M15]
MKMRLSETVLELKDECIRVRRDLHRIPETAFKEFKTHDYIYQYMEALKPDQLLTLAGTGVKAVFMADNKDETIAFRADIDALPIQERTNVPFQSEHPGCMHACGHDGHATVAMMLGKLLSTRRKELPCNVVLLFQPGEEGGSGAKVMIDDGALHNPRVDRIYALHMFPELRLGQLGVKRGTFMAQSCGFDLTVVGKSAHGANPEKGIDAVVASAEIITLLQTVVSRSTSPDEPVVLTIGKIHGGEARNIICDRVTMSGTLRTFSSEMRLEIMERMKKILAGLEVATGVKIDFQEVQLYYSVENPVDMTEEFQLLLKEDLKPMPHLMIGEDFSFYQQTIPGLFFFVGIAEYSGFPPLHSPFFNFNEEALLYGLEAYCRMLQLVER